MSQDRILAQRIADEGRACVIALNKWDAVVNKNDKTYLSGSRCNTLYFYAISGFNVKFIRMKYKIPSELYGFYQYLSVVLRLTLSLILLLSLLIIAIENVRQYLSSLKWADVRIVHNYSTVISSLAFVMLE